MLGTIQNAGTLLDLFDEAQPEWGVTEVAEALGISKSKAYYLLSSLVSIGLLKRTVDSRYRVGWRALALSRVLLSSDDLWTESQHVMNRLANAFGVQLSLLTLEGQDVVFLGSLAGAHPVREVRSNVGRRMPALRTDAGRLLLAYGPRQHLDAVLDGHECSSPDAMAKRAQLRQVLNLVRRQGWASYVSRCRKGTGSVAAPISDHTGSVVAALNISAPLAEFDRRKEEFRRAVVAAARDISQNLGYIHPLGCEHSSSTDATPAFIRSNGGLFVGT